LFFVCTPYYDINASSFLSKKKKCHSLSPHYPFTDGGGVAGVEELAVVAAGDRAT
jgi:hypothetical protein